MNFLWRGWLLACVLLLSACSLRKPSGVDLLKPCKSAEGPSDGYCGTLDVWEDRAAKAGRKISLKIVVLPALKQNFAPDPVFFLAGGPGQGAAALVRDVQDQFHAFELDRDLVFVDQRGTGKSNPLECKLAGEDEQKDNDASGDAEDDASDDNGAFLVGRMRACLEKLKAKADLTKYTTPIAMDDLDDVRQFLGYSKINLLGVSYGTRAAIVYARRHAANTRAVILDSVAPTDMRLPLYMARDSQRALDLLFRDCEQDSGCNQRFPKIRERFKTLIDRLAAHPQHIHYVHPRTGIEKEMDVRRLTVGSIVFASLYSPETASLVPLLIEEAEKGNFSGLLAFSAGPLVSNMAMGMHFSVVCSEDAPGIEAGAVERETEGTFLGPDMANLRLKTCEFWPRAQVEPAYFENAPSDIPALILSGDLDPITPAVWGKQIASVWKNSRQIVVPGTGHGAFNSKCVVKLMSQFLNAGSAANLDASCVDLVKRPPFFLGPSGPDPLAGASSATAHPKAVSGAKE